MRNCDTHIFNDISKSGIEAILKGLSGNGSLVTGTNPWDVDTRQHGVRLRGNWLEEASQLTITVLDADWYGPKKKIWDRIQCLILLVREKTRV
jgi:hypothetical protein